jgi:excisionase family DNA binding protein
MTDHIEQPQRDERFLTVAEVAALLQVGGSTVYALISKGLLPAYRVGPAKGGIRVSQADLKAYLESVRIGKRYRSNGEARRSTTRQHLKHIRV